MKDRAVYLDLWEREEQLKAKDREIARRTVAMKSKDLPINISATSNPAGIPLTINPTRTVGADATLGAAYSDAALAMGGMILMDR